MAVTVATAWGAGSASAADGPATSWIPNGVVYASAVRGDVAYIGGWFNRVSEPTGPGVLLDGAAGSRMPAASVQGERVNAAVPDGSGGWYVGGAFEAVGGVPRSGLAHLLPSGQLDDDWRADVSGNVRALALGGGVLYVGGDFRTLGGQPRNMLGAVDAATGAVTDWTPTADRIVTALAASGTTVFAAGGLATYGPPVMPNLAAYDASTGAFKPFAAQPRDEVKAMAATPDRLYYSAGIEPLRAVDATTGASIGWGDGLPTGVAAIAVRGSTVFVGGSFTLTDPSLAVHENLAAVDADTGAMLAWNPRTDDHVYSLAVDGSKVYAGGWFRHAGGQPRSSLAAFDASTGALDSWNPDANGDVYALGTFDGKVFAGGVFTGVGGVKRNGVAAIDLRTGEPTPWDPDLNGFPVRAMLLSGSTLYVAGDFTSVSGEPRGGLAAVDVDTGSVLPFAPAAITGEVDALALHRDTLFLGGRLGAVGGVPRVGLAAVSTATGALADWQADTGWVHALALSGSTLYVGGELSTIGGKPRSSLAAVDVDTGEVLPWSWRPRLGLGYQGVSALAVSEHTLYVGRTWLHFAGETGGLSAVDLRTGEPASWDPAVVGPVYAIAVRGSTVYFGGGISSAGGLPRRGLAAASRYTGAARAWQPQLSAGVATLAVDGDRLIAGGYFRYALPTAQAELAVFAPFHDRPEPLGLPAIVGTPSPGTMLSCRAPLWDNDPSKVATVWLRDGLSVASEPDHLIAEAERGHKLACRVDAQNSDGSASVTSAAITVMPADAPNPPEGRPPVPRRRAGVARLRATRLRLTSSGVLRVPVACHGGGWCRGRLTLRVRQGDRARIVGRRTALIAPSSREHRVAVRLTAYGRSLIARHRSTALIATFATPGHRPLRARLTVLPPAHG